VRILGKTSPMILPMSTRRTSGLAAALAVPLMLLALISVISSPQTPGSGSPRAMDGRSPPSPPSRLGDAAEERRRRLAGDGNGDPSSDRAFASPGPIGRTLAKALGWDDDDPLRALFVVTTLSEYEKGTRGTTRGADRLSDVVIPVLKDSVESMVRRGWDVDVFLVLGYEELRPERRAIVEGALPEGVGLEVWEDAMPLYYKKKGRQREPRPDQRAETASHGLSRQHRYVVRDKLDAYDLFLCFEDDMRVTADHAVNFLELSAGLEALKYRAESAPDGLVHVEGESIRPRSSRGKPADGAPVGNDVVDDPLSAEYLGRVLPGFLRVEVLDAKGGDGASHPLLRDNKIDRPKYSSEVPVDRSVSRSIDPDVCCGEDPPGRGKMAPNPDSSAPVIWETNVGAMGVRKYPHPVGWAGALPVQDSADVGSYWSGEGGVLGDMSRPRRLDATLGQQAGWMATRSQVEYFHRTACPGGFLPPFEEDDPHWRGDSLQRYAVEHWSGGFQLFGECRLNRIMSLDSERFSRHLLYHTANNKQRTKGEDFFVRAGDLLGQLHTVKDRAAQSIQA